MSWDLDGKLDIYAEFAVDILYVKYHQNFTNIFCNHSNFSIGM